MPRPLRLQYVGAIYHVMSRGDRRQRIVRDDRDRQRFVETLAEACAKTGWQVHAWCLMDNHFHGVIETPQPNLVYGMQWLLGTYTQRYNRRHKLVGHLFSGRYKAVVVDGSQSGYLRTVCDYVHLNPDRAGLLRAEQQLREYRWSSYGEYLQAPSRRAKWLRADRLLGEMRIPKDSAAGRRQFENLLEHRRAEQKPGDWKGLRRGWCFGDETFRRELLAAMQEKVGPSHYGRERQEAAEEKARRIVQEELGRLGWEPGELKRRLKGDHEKVRLARRLRAETTVTLKWIASTLAMGTWTYVANRLYHGSI
jgi:putative transposase